MVREQIQARGIQHPAVLNAMSEVPRHLFVPEEYRWDAYADRPLPIGLQQTISQPYIVALMTVLIDPQTDDVVLEVGSGSGYQAAILSRLVHQVHSIDQFSELTGAAQAVTQQLHMHNIHYHLGDGSQGLLKYAPFDAILVTAAGPVVPQPLLDQLKIGGRLVLPVGERHMQRLERWLRVDQDNYEHEDHGGVNFVPLTGKFGWD